jgi:hypothetical protein
MWHLTVDIQATNIVDEKYYEFDIAEIDVR